ncbi:hypothetical protein [Methylococcus mesophilus]|uniref:hypothetical protein n=1 Tax=Methylococcus mesophilus TaxID=2993564 RepID=UPI00224A9707|nr:hypothetical protein [Methylococcus mesophilus]UZR29039.1 hypothetical protein OOT43_20415 [Methylococcus mesophilus]
MNACPDVVSIQLGHYLAQVDRDEAYEEGFEAFKADADLAAILDTDALLWALYNRDMSEDEVRSKIESALRKAYAGQLARRAEEDAPDRYEALRYAQTFCF